VAGQPRMKATSLWSSGLRSGRRDAVRLCSDAGVLDGGVPAMTIARYTAGCSSSQSD
jgi:hypothetical protein